MLNEKRKYGNLLPKLQKKIILSLAENEPMTMSETNKKISGQLTSTSRAVHELEIKKMIAEVAKWEYRGRKFSKYWLSDKGVAFALLNDRNVNTIERIALSIRKNETLETYFELRNISPKIAHIIDKAILLRGKIEPEELVKLLIPEIASTEKVDFEKFFNAIEKSEKYEEILDHYVGHLKKFINELEKK